MSASWLRPVGLRALLVCFDSPHETVGHGIGSGDGIHHGSLVRFGLTLVNDESGTDRRAVRLGDAEGPSTAVGAFFKWNGVVLYKAQQHT